MEGQNIGEWFQHLEDLIEDQVHLIRETLTRDWNNKFLFRKNQLVIDQFGTPVEVMITSLKNIGHWEATWSRFMSQIWSDLLSKICSPDHTLKVINPPVNENLNTSTGNNSFNNTMTRYDDSGPALMSTTIRKDRCVVEIEYAKPALSSIDVILRNVVQVLHTLFLTFPDGNRVSFIMF